MDQPAGILNLAAALDRVGGDTELLEEVARLFLGSAAEMLGEVRQAVAGRDARALERAAHTLKGSVGNFGADLTFEAALRLERMGRDGDLAGADDALASLEREIARLQPALTALAEKRDR